MLKVIEKEENFLDLIYVGNFPLRPNTIVLELRGRILTEPTRISIQIGENKHIEDGLGQFINHNCNPSCKIENNYVLSVKNINKGDSITFNYNESEDIISNPFKCKCCNKMILGRNI